MRHVTLTLALVITLIISVPVAAQDTFSVQGDGVFSLVLERLDVLLSSWFEKDASEATTDTTTTDAAALTPEDGPIEPPTADGGPLLEPNG